MAVDQAAVIEGAPRSTTSTAAGRPTSAKATTSSPAASASPAAGSAAAAGSTPVASGKAKLLEVGWDAPTPQYAARHLAAMERRPFDGVVMELAALQGNGNRFLITKPISSGAFDGDRAAIASIRSSKLTDNFIRLDSSCDKGWDWFDDADWAATQTTVRGIARTAAAGQRPVGIYLDPEAYGRSCWNYPAQQQASRVSFEKYEAMARARGESFITELQRANPKITVLGSALISGVKDASWLNPSVSAAQARGALRGHVAGLLPAFVDGMVRAARPGTVIADGNENSYYALNADWYWSGERAVINRGASRVVQGYDAQRYRQHYRHDYAVYADLVLDLFDPSSPDCAQWCGQWVPHYLSGADRLRLLERQVYDALDTADGYVWYYSEQQDWWPYGGRVSKQGFALPAVSAAADAAVSRARDRFRAGQGSGPSVTAAFEAARRACRAAGGKHCD
ncbi:MAG: hypothetical protein ACRC35_12810 [Angustibacter sp.]